MPKGIYTLPGGPSEALITLLRQGHKPTKKWLIKQEGDFGDHVALIRHELHQLVWALNEFDNVSGGLLIQSYYVTKYITIYRLCQQIGGTTNDMMDFFEPPVSARGE